VCTLQSCRRNRRDGELGEDLPLARDDTRVEARQVQASVEAGVFDLDAAVHDDVHPGGLGVRRNPFVPGAELQPDRLRADGLGLLEDAGGIVFATGFTKYTRYFVDESRYVATK
jgi:hypothetical protein